MLSEQEQTLTEVLSHLAERTLVLTPCDEVVKYRETFEDLIEVQIGNENEYADNNFSLTPSEALKLLDWLTQEKPVLELLAKAQEEGDEKA